MCAAPVHVVSAAQLRPTLSQIRPGRLCVTQSPTSRSPRTARDATAVVVCHDREVVPGVCTCCKTCKPPRNVSPALVPLLFGPLLPSHNLAMDSWSDRAATPPRAVLSCSSAVYLRALCSSVVPRELAAAVCSNLGPCNTSPGYFVDIKVVIGQRWVGCNPRAQRYSLSLVGVDDSPILMPFAPHRLYRRSRARKIVRRPTSSLP